MPSAIYLPTDMHSHPVRVSRSHGGCGETHIVSDEGELFCDDCAPTLLKYHGAAYERESVQLNPTELKQKERLDTEGKKQIEAYFQAFGKAIGEAQKEVKPTHTKPVRKPRASKVSGA